jgi:hypothetical protein
VREKVAPERNEIQNEAEQSQDAKGARLGKTFKPPHSLLHMPRIRIAFFVASDSP